MKLDDQGKLPPHNIEAEQAVLGSILVDPDCIAEVGGIIQPSDFYREKNKWVYEAMLELGSGVNHVTVCHELQVAGHLEEVGGPAYLSDLAGNLPTSVHAKYYANIVRDCAYCRKVIVLGGKMAGLGYSGEGTPTEMFEKCHDMLQDISPDHITDLVTPEQHAERLMEMLLHRQDHTEAAIRFGWPGLDSFLAGLYPGDYLVIGGRPGHGKTEIALEIARHNCVRCQTVNGVYQETPNKKVLVASAEMSLEQLDEREIAMWGITIPQLRSGQLDKAQWDALWNLPPLIKERPMYYLEGRLTIDHIHQRAQLLQKTKGLDLIVIDYIQLLRDTVNRRGDGATRERISYISASTKNMARELKVPVIMLSQLNREVEYREDKMPRPSDLRESGTIEQDADIILLLCRPELYDAEDEPGICYIDVAKARQIGKKKRLTFKWLPAQHRYGEQEDRRDDEPHGGGVYWE